MLFIDDAYSLAVDKSNKDYGREIVDLLVAEMTSPTCKAAIFLAGYSEEMNLFFSRNRGLSSRFASHIHFPDYSITELLKILEKYCEEQELHFTKKAKTAIAELIREQLIVGGLDFGNARFIVNLVEQCKKTMAVRVLPDIEEQPKEELRRIVSSITEKDVATVWLSLLDEANVQ